MKYDKHTVNEYKIDENTTRKILANGGKLMQVQMDFRNTTTEMICHSHPHEQVTYIVKGKFKFSINDKEIILGEGDSIYIEPNIQHGCIVLEKESRLVDVFTPQRTEFLY